MRHVPGGIAAIAAVLVLGGAPAAAGPAVADFQIFVNAGSTRQAQTIANGGTANITRLAFYAGLIIDHNGGGEEASARVRFILPDGLHWGPDVPDATETCTGTGSAACRYRTPKTAKGQTLKGSVSFAAGGKKFTKRFTTRFG
jgi:hypothetical protein